MARSGTRGRDLRQYGSERDGRRIGYADIGGERHGIKADVITIGGYSGHADQNDLMDFVSGMSHWPSGVRIVHGDEGTKAGLAQKLIELAANRGGDLQVLIADA